jgi:molybdopterin molybdotransferase
MMISVSQAKKIIRESCEPLSPVITMLENAARHVLAAEVLAPYDIPGFVQSSMDGYAFAFDYYVAGIPMKISGERAAGPSTGEARNFILKPGEACRIFTGAALPAGADTVIMQEKTSRQNDQLIVSDHEIIKGQFVRNIGAETRKSAQILPGGHYLNPPSISYLAATGITEVSVYPLPVVSLIITGNEFQPRGNTPGYGLVFESNSIGLKAALNDIGIHKVNIFYVNDTLKATLDVLRTSLAESDLVLITGGVSVGDYDFVVSAANECGVETMFHKVKQKPGKPLFFGMKNKIAVFGLPGNPSSVLTCYYEYVLPALERLSLLPVVLKELPAKLEQPVTKPAGLTHFMKAVYDNGVVRFLNAQESFRLSSFANANCLLVIDEEVTSVAEDATVNIHLLP